MSHLSPLTYLTMALAGYVMIDSVSKTRNLNEDMMQVVETTKKYGKTLTTLGLGFGCLGIFYMMYKEKSEQTKLLSTLTNEVEQTCFRYRVNSWNT